MVRPPTDTDLVWPLPATHDDIDRYEKFVAEQEAKFEAIRKQMDYEMPVPIDA